jgi:DNA primase
MAAPKKLVSDAFIGELLDRVDIVRLIDDRLGGKLKKTGANYKCNCPFHEEETPSFVVSETKQVFTCFGGCFGGKGSNAINFIREYDQVDFTEAVTILCERVGMEPPFGKEENLDPMAQKKKDVLACLADAKDLYAGFLKDAKYKDPAIDYLKNRGITGQTAKQFSIGFAPAEWAIAMKRLSKKHGRETLKAAGLIVEKNGKPFDLFRDRIMFPISDRKGRVVAFGGRRRDDNSDTPKYINSPETIVFQKSKELYNFDKAQNAARKTGKLYIVEGYTDVTSHGQFGIEDTVAPLGTAFTEGQLEKVLSVTSEPIMCFDGDKAGREAGWKSMMMSLPHLNDGVRMKFLFYPEGQDPDTLLRSEGVDAYMGRLAQAMPLSQFVITELTNRYGSDTPESKAAVAHGAADVISKMPHGVYREVMLTATAQAVGLPEQRLVDAIAHQHPNAKVTPAHPTKGRPLPNSVTPPVASTVQPQQKPVPKAEASAPGPTQQPARRPSPAPGNHFTGGGLVPGMTGAATAAAPRFAQFQKRNEQALADLQSSGDVENFTRQAVIGELKQSQGAINARYLADNVTKTIEDVVGKDAASEMAPKIRNYTLTATEQYNKRLAEHLKHGSSPAATPGASPSTGMGMGR